MQLVSFLFFLLENYMSCPIDDKNKKMCPPSPFFSPQSQKFPLIIQVPTGWPLWQSTNPAPFGIQTVLLLENVHLLIYVKDLLTVWSCTWMLEDYMQRLKSIITHLLSSQTDLHLPEFPNRKWVTLTLIPPAGPGYFCQANFTRF